MKVMLTRNHKTKATTFGQNSKNFSLRSERMMQMNLRVLVTGSVEQFVLRRQVHFLEFQVQYTISQLVKYTVSDRNFAAM